MPQEKTHTCYHGCVHEAIGLRTQMNTVENTRIFKLTGLGKTVQTGQEGQGRQAGHQIATGRNIGC